MNTPNLSVVGWQLNYIIAPDQLRDTSRSCERCGQKLIFGHQFWNPLVKQHLLTCGPCGAYLVPGYSAKAEERRAQHYLDRELLFLTPRLWRPVKGKRHDIERWVMIGGLKWLVTVWREGAKSFRVTLTSARDAEAKGTSPDKATTVELGKRLAFKVVTRMRNVVRDSGCGEPTGENLDGVEG